VPEGSKIYEIIYNILILIIKPWQLLWLRGNSRGDTGCPKSRIRSLS
jgi:hypothetical protein